MAGNKRAKRDLAKRQKAGDYSGGAEAIMSTYGNKRLKATRGDRESVGFAEEQRRLGKGSGWQPSRGDLENLRPDLFSDRRQEGRRETPQ